MSKIPRSYSPPLLDLKLNDVTQNLDKAFDDTMYPPIDLSTLEDEEKYFEWLSGQKSVSQRRLINLAPSKKRNSFKLSILSEDYWQDSQFQIISRS